MAQELNRMKGDALSAVADASGTVASTSSAAEKPPPFSGSSVSAILALHEANEECAEELYQRAVKLVLEKLKENVAKIVRSFSLVNRI